MASAKKAKVVNKKKNKKSAVPKVDLVTWNTSDSDEIERRKIRAQEERFTIVNQDPSVIYFSDYRISAYQAKKFYQVEIRHLDQRINSCDCQDYRINQLGTCKHIEAILFALRKKGVKKFKQAAVEQSQRVEIFMKPASQCVISSYWPQNVSEKVKKTIGHFFLEDGELISNSLIFFNQLLAEISSKKIVKNKIRISAHIQYYLDYQKNQLDRRESKKNFDQNIKKNYSLPIKYPLLPYQKTGMMHLAFVERALLADEMGLGKTVQAIAACILLQYLKGIKRVLVITPASLKAEWEEQIAKFTDFPSLIIYGAKRKRLIQYQQPTFFYLVNYEQVVSDYNEIQSLLAPDVIILDEAQRIKNWRTKTANAVKELKSRYAFVLTGTPVENRIDDIYSIAQFLDPHIFGPLFRFNRDFYQLDPQGKPEGYKNLHELYHRLRPIMLCRKKSDVEGELPKRVSSNFFVKMAPEQRVRYEEYEGYVARLVQQASRRPLRKEEFEKLQRWLACMRMLCDTPFILDKDCRISPKVKELEIILLELLARPETKIIIFSEWERMLQLVKEVAEKNHWQFAWHTGSVQQHKRRDEIQQFKQKEHCRLFLSTDSGSVGLNLQAANVVINLDLPWNPAKLEQRIARAWRKFQLRSVQIINLICENSIEHRMLHLLEEKKRMAEGVLTGDEALSAMKMPSGRAALMERIQTLIEEAPQVVADQKEDEHKKFKEQVVDTLGDSLSLLQTYEGNDRGNDEKKTILLAVVENLTKVTPVNIDSSITMEMIDKETLAIIQRLAEAGVLTLHAPTKTLHDEQSPERQQQRRKKQVERSKIFFEQAKRKHHMVQVLIASGFHEEALLPLRDALHASLQALSELMPQKPEGEFTLSKVNKIMHAHAELIGLPTLFEKLSLSKEKESNIEELYQEHQKILDYLLKLPY